MVIRSQRDRIFCSGANINMLGLSSHDQKVNFCKFTNETRLAIEDASAAFRPELHLLDQRHRRRRRLRAGAGLRADPAGRRRLERGVAARAAAARRAARHRRPHAPGRQAHGAARPRRFLLHHRRGRARQARARVAAGRQADPAQQARRRDQEDRRGRRRASRAGPDAKGIALPPVERTIDGDAIRYAHLTVEIDRERRAAQLPRQRPGRRAASRRSPPSTPQGAAFWPLALARELDDAILHLRPNETEIGTWVLHEPGRCATLVEAYDALLARKRRTGWCARSCSTGSAR